MKTKLENNEIKVVVHLNFETMVKEINTDDYIFSAEALKSLTDKQNKYIIEIMKKATNYSIHTGRDILQIARLIQNQHTKKWSYYEEDWNSTISKIQYEFDVNSQITKSFILSNKKSESQAQK
jgi:spore germination protein KC